MAMENVMPNFAAEVFRRECARDTEHHLSENHSELVCLPCPWAGDLIPWAFISSLVNWVLIIKVVMRIKRFNIYI